MNYTPNNTSNNDLSYQDCSGCNWRNRNFSHHVFKETKLNGGDLSHCNINGSNLQNAQLCGTNLTNASLCGADLLNARLNGANLYQANLTGANLTGADLRCANLRKANLNKTTFDNTNVEDAVLEGCNGLTDELKRDLKSRGAILICSTSNVEYIKWWVRYVAVPIFVALIGVSFFLKPSQESLSPTAPIKELHN